MKIPPCINIFLLFHKLHKNKQTVFFWKIKEKEKIFEHKSVKDIIGVEV